MFVFSEWDNICSIVSQERRCIRADEILAQKSDDWLLIKHDVETDPLKALRIAKIEHAYGIRATYYVQVDLLEKWGEVFGQIAALGHEVTYHYDVLDACEGSYVCAKEAFSKALKAFAKWGFAVTTVCPHGNPVKIREGWSSNKDFFRNREVNDSYGDILDIVVHLRSRLGYAYTYISDAGYGWKQIVNVDSNDQNNREDIELGSNADLLTMLRENKGAVILSTHPHRWESSSMAIWWRQYLFKAIRAIARAMAKIPLMKRIMSRYYYLAKKI